MDKEWLTRVGEILKTLLPIPSPTHPSTSGFYRPSPTATVASNTAYHECGHAIIGWHDSFVHEIEYVEIRDDSGICASITHTDPGPECYWTSITRHLGGIAAETRFFKKFRSGESEKDLKNARNVSRMLLATFPRTTCPWRPNARGSVDLGKMFYGGIGSRERDILNTCYDKACHIIDWRRSAVQSAALELTRRGRLTGADLERHFQSRQYIQLMGVIKPGFITFDS